MTTTQHSSRSLLRSLDRVATSVLVVLHALVFVRCVQFSGFFVMATDSCDSSCDTGTLTVAYIIADGGGLVVLLVGAIAAARRARRGDTAWWVPSTGIVVQILLLVAGGAMANSIMAS
ncbi:hypothetical protein [Williamsia sterculiae]|uniref:Uncharacterized protein n=1 Tax=Williamsia sterculiae TaxID=1344003 RepID=A0A1N7DMI2_9NOCA|nr:hypothetical protein [Williamsia sterculiae]SIR77062.1 hypothetical protein SAMN05445060_0765 [Williamsia sterculiae]